MSNLQVLLLGRLLKLLCIAADNCAVVTPKFAGSIGLCQYVKGYFARLTENRMKSGLASGIVIAYKLEGSTHKTTCLCYLQ